MLSRAVYNFETGRFYATVQLGYDCLTAACKCPTLCYRTTDQSHCIIGCLTWCHGSNSCDCPNLFIQSVDLQQSRGIGQAKRMSLYRDTVENERHILFPPNPERYRMYPNMICPGIQQWRHRHAIWQFENMGMTIQKSVTAVWISGQWKYCHQSWRVTQHVPNYNFDSRFATPSILNISLI